jgi:mono/diheme cytochrome c family protein
MGSVIRRGHSSIAHRHPVVHRHLRAKRRRPRCACLAGNTGSERIHRGETAFKTHCARCHGTAAVGTDQGPSLLWKIYAPNHHSDASFHLPVQQGVRSHHWRFGNMPPVPTVTQDEVAQIIAYVRWLQQQAGVQ